MYHEVITQCAQSLRNLLDCLDKAEQHAATKKFDIGVLMNRRLAPDMQPFVYQVQSACDTSKRRLHGSQGRGRRYIRTTNRPSMNCAHAFKRPSASWKV